MSRLIGRRYRGVHRPGTARPPRTVLTAVTACRHGLIRCLCGDESEWL